MKLILLFVLSCLALHNGTGAPATARYMLVKCNPKDDKANCVTHQGPEIAWSPDLPTQLPASGALGLESEPVEDEHPDREEGEEQRPIGDEGESPFFLKEDGSGFNEGSAEGEYVEDLGFQATESETGSGETDVELSLAKEMKEWSVAKPDEEELKGEGLITY